MDNQDTDAVAFFGAQLLTAIIGNLVANDLYDPALAKTNILEALDQGTKVFSKRHHANLAALAKVFLGAVDRGVSSRDQQ